MNNIKELKDFEAFVIEYKDFFKKYNSVDADDSGLEPRYEWNDELIEYYINDIININTLINLMKEVKIEDYVSVLWEVNNQDLESEFQLALVNINLDIDVITAVSIAISTCDDWGKSFMSSIQNKYYPVSKLSIVEDIDNELYGIYDKEKNQVIVIEDISSLIKKYNTDGHWSQVNEEQGIAWLAILKNIKVTSVQ